MDKLLYEKLKEYRKGLEELRLDHDELLKIIQDLNPTDVKEKEQWRQFCLKLTIYFFNRHSNDLYFYNICIDYIKT